MCVGILLFFWNRLTSEPTHVQPNFKSRENVEFILLWESLTLNWMWKINTMERFQASFQVYLNLQWKQKRYKSFAFYFLSFSSALSIHHIQLLENHKTSDLVIAHLQNRNVMSVIHKISEKCVPHTHIQIHIKCIVWRLHTYI